VSTLLNLLAAAIAVGFLGVWSTWRDCPESSGFGEARRLAGTPARSFAARRAGAVDRLVVAEVACHDHRRQRLAVDWARRTMYRWVGAVHRALLNSVGIGLITTVLAVALATPAAYRDPAGFRGKARAPADAGRGRVPTDGTGRAAVRVAGGAHLGRSSVPVARAAAGDGR
jgi:ABC-type glycerol-3-phosphate transport system permease component